MRRTLPIVTAVLALAVLPLVASTADARPHWYRGERYNYVTPYYAGSYYGGYRNWGYPASYYRGYYPSYSYSYPTYSYPTHSYRYPYGYTYGYPRYYYQPRISVGVGTPGFGFYYSR